MSSLYEIASFTTHNKHCDERQADVVWIDDDGRISRSVSAFSTTVRLCRDRACPHPLHGVEARFVHLQRIPPAWADWVHLQPKELLF